jgi:4-aminobutyrate aminotransferase-like enzyme/Ser/Thr protein kinase RdoA (MazF antagonist)/murein DD-endopeptidase MepM/ murein hydrolase activator NlpD
MVIEPIIRPSLAPEEALQVVRDEFGIAAESARSLPSDRDQNFLIQDQGSAKRYVLKVSHAGEDPAVLDLQNRMLEHLARAGFTLSIVLPSLDGGEVVTRPAKDGSVFFTRLLSWVPGTPMFRVNPQHQDLLQSLGSFLGGLDRALEDFSHPAQDRELKWDLRRAAQVVETHLEYVENPTRRKLLESLTRSFLQRLDPLLPELRLSVIHADANDHNVLVSDLEPGQDPATRTVSGLVDFGDAVRTFKAGEVAIAGAYAMLDKDDPFSAASHIVRGYHKALPLKEVEIAALFPLMGLRLCTSVAISAHQKRLEPDNQYLIVSEAPAWRILERLEGEILDLPHLLFRETCGLEPIPASRRVVEWLEAHGGEASPVVAKPETADPGRIASSFTPVDLERVPVHIFDLSPDSVEFPQAPDPEDVEAWTDLIWRRMREVGAEVGVGRYDEVRQWYVSDLFRTSSDDPPEWRTVHIGADIFLDAGSPILAPFDGVVHSVTNNVGSQDYGPTVLLEHAFPSETGGRLTFWTLYGHLADDVLPRLEPGREIRKGEAFARIGDYPVNGNWAPHLHFQVITDLLGLSGNFPGVAPPSQRELWKSLSPDPNPILKIPGPEGLRDMKSRALAPDQGPAVPGRPSGVPLSRSGGRSVEEILEARRKHLGPTLSVAYRNPIKIVRGSGQFLYDHQGQRYLDCVNNVPHVGHNHPRVVAAGQTQMAILNTNTRYLHDLLVDYAERLVETMPDPLSVVYFTCTGSEANELALRLARTHTGRRDVVVVEGGYHGNTSAMVDISPYKFDRAGGEGAPPWVHKTFLPDPYRGRFRSLPVPEGDEQDGVQYLPPQELGPRYAEELGRLLTDIQSQDREPAAFFCESILGCGGQIVLPDGYMAHAFQRVREAGGLCVADEVQVGFGRAGTHFWAFETQGVVPDIVTLGKPMANGHPLSAVITTPEIAGSFETGMEYFNTFGGNPVSLAIGMAVLDVMEEEGLQENARVVGEALLESLAVLQAQNQVIGDVRGLGLYLGVEVVSDRATRTPDSHRASRIKERLREHRILLSTDGPDDNVLKIKPPLVFSREDAHRLVSTLGKVLQEDGIRL